MAKVKKQVLPEKVLTAPMSKDTMLLEFMTSTYPIGFGYSDKGNVLLFVHDHTEGEEAVVLEHLISPKILERIIEIAQETLDNLGRHTLGVKLK